MIMLINKKNIFIAGSIFVGAFMASLLVQSGELFLSEMAIKISGTILGVGFFVNGVYGLLSGRVYGRSWKKYWGGWISREENLYFFWSYVFLSFFVATVLFFSCVNVFWS